MKDDGLRDGNKSYNVEKNKRLRDIFIAIASIIFIIVLVGLNYVPQIDKVYSPDSYYKGVYAMDSKEDPVVAYNKLMGGSGKRPESNCETNMTILTESDVCSFGGGNNAVPRVMDKSSFVETDIAAYGDVYGGAALSIDGDNNHWYLWNEAGITDMNIISPYINFQFKNDNFGSTSSKTTDIWVGPSKSENYLKVVDVQNWFCHMSNNDTVNTHGTKIGIGATEDELKGYNGTNGFVVLGKAKTSTYVVGIKIVGGVEEECSPLELLAPSLVP